MSNKKELLFSITKKDFKIDYFSGKGGGGQHRNKHQNCVRLTHVESGVTCTGQSNKERLANQKEAFNNLVNNPQFKLWYNAKIKEVLTGKSVQEKVNEMMKEENLHIEGKSETGQWIPLHPVDLRSHSEGKVVKCESKETLVDDLYGLPDLKTKI